VSDKQKIIIMNFNHFEVPDIKQLVYH